MRRPVQILLLAGLAAAINLAAVTSVRADPRHEVASVKYSALQELRDLLAQELNHLYPSQNRVSVYLELAIPNYIITEVKLSLDLSEAITRRYSREQAQALVNRGADRLLRFNASPGKHRLKIEYQGVFLRPSGKEIPVNDSLSLEFETKPGSQAFIMPAAPKILRPVRTLADRDKRDNWRWKSETKDPRLDYVRYLWDTGENFAGVLELLRVAGASNNNDAPPRGFSTLMGQVYANLGMRNRAMQAALDARKNDTDADALNALWLQIAALDYQQQNFDNAELVLNLVPADADQAQQTQVLDLKSRILMAQNKHAEAAALLAPVIAGKADINEPLGHLDFNYAVALIKSGVPQQGRAALAGIGESDTQPAALRDRANLILGYHLLREADATQAKTVLQRLPLSGPYANRGLLGLGWSEVWPAGCQQSACLQRALTAWKTLAQGNPADPAVQEALAAAPYALEQLGQYEAASAAYQTAVNAYTQLETHLQSQAQALRRGEFKQAILNDDYETLPPMAAMKELISSHRFQSHAKNYRDLVFLQQAIAERDGSKQVQQRLETTAQQAVEVAQSELADVIEQQLQNTKLYQINARLGLLRNFNRQKKAADSQAVP